MVTRKAWLQLIGYFTLAFVAGAAITGRGFYTHTVGLDIVGIFMVVLSSVMLIKCVIYQITVRRYEAVDNTEQAGKQGITSRYTYGQWEILYYPVLALDLIVAIIFFAMGQMVRVYIPS